MDRTSRRAVITGLGVISPLGCTPGRFWQALCAGTSGVGPIGAFDASGLPVRIAAQVPDFDGKHYLDKKDRKSLKVMARTIQLAVAGAHDALADSGVDMARLDPTRFGVDFGANLIASELEELGPPARLSASGRIGEVDLRRWGGEGLASMPPLWMLKYLPNMLACHVAILHNAQGPNNTITESDVASLLAIGEAYRVLQRGLADFMLAGGGDSKINPLSMARQCTFAQLSRRNDAPELACRPFDRDRDGGVIGEGGTVLVLEELGHARNRGARIYAEVVGFGAAFDTDRSGAGVRRAVRAALADAGVGPDAIDHVNAHGVGTVGDDRAEARGLHDALNADVPVFAAKSYFGNLGAAAGATELAASVLALARGHRPGSLHCEHPDPMCPVHVPLGAPRPVTQPCAVKVGLTDLGQCAAVVIRRWEGP